VDFVERIILALSDVGCKKIQIIAKGPPGVRAKMKKVWDGVYVSISACTS
jgi:hypothetical protein